MKKFFYIFITVAIGAMIASIFLSDNIHQIEGDFKELAFVRNENNTGPVKRLYAFSLSDTLWSNMEKHAALLPHTKYGTTEVFYCLAQDKPAEVTLKLNNSKGSDFGGAKCIAYVKIDGMGKLQFERFPFGQ